MLDSLRQTLDAYDKSKEVVKSTVDLVKSIGKGTKGAVMDKVNEELQKVKAKTELTVEYTKQLIELETKVLPIEAERDALQVAYDTAYDAYTATDTTMKDAEASVELVKKRVARKKAEAVEKGLSSQETPLDQELEEKKNLHQKAKDQLAKAKDQLDKLSQKIADKTAEANDYRKQIELIKIKMNPATSVAMIQQIENRAKATQDVSAGTPTNTPKTTTDEGVILTQEDIEQAKAEGEEREKQKEDEMKQRQPMLDKIDAEWMTVEMGIKVLQNLATPLPQTATLPVAIGTAAPNPAFNMAVAGSVGLLAAFVLVSTKAAAVRWASLCEEAGVEPPADKLIQIQLINTLAAALPAACATGATYVSPVMSNLL